MKTWQDKIIDILLWKIKIGNTFFSFLGCIEFFILLGIVLLLTTLTRRFFRSRILLRTGLTPALQGVLARFAGCFVAFIGLLISFQILGIELASLAFLAGTLGLGLGFGLQNIISNFVSGLIILIEKPIQAGDRIDVGGLQGDVVEISTRSTKIITNDNITIIVPNSEFISSRVINWSHGDSKVRFPVPVGVAYDSDPRLVEKALLEAAQIIPDVLKIPSPTVRLISFGDNAIYFELRVWTDTQVHRKIKLVSEVNFAIFEKFQKYGIKIPFPQRDIYIKSMATPEKPLSDKEVARKYLRNHKLFQSLSDDDIAELVEKASVRKFYSQQPIIQQGDEGNSLFVILNGIAGIHIQKPDSSSTRITTLGRGDFFGEMSMLTGEKRSATILAETILEAYEIGKECFQPILSRNPNLANILSRVLADYQKQDKARRSAEIQDASKFNEDSTYNLLHRIQSFFKLS